MAVEDLKKDGVEAELFIEDTPFSGAGVISSINRLLNANQVDAIAGNFSNMAMFAMGNILERAKIPTFHTAAVDPAIANFPRYVFSTNVRIKDEAYHLAQYLYGQGYKRAGVITIQTNFGESYRDFFEERFLQLGGEIVASESFQIQDIDYKSQLTKLREKKPDVLFAACFGGFLGRVLKQTRELKMPAPVYSVYESEDRSVLDASQGAADGLRYFVSISDANASFIEFRRRYLDKYKREPGTFAANAYDATILLGRAFKRCSMDRGCVVDELYRTRGFNGVSGLISIEHDGVALKSFVLKEVRDGEFREVR